MIAKKVKSNKRKRKSASIRDLLHYIANPNKTNANEKVLYANARNFICDDFASQREEMVALASESVRSKNPTNHYIFSWREGEHPTTAQVDEAVTIILLALNLVDHQCMYAVHQDTDNKHLHLVVNKVHPETNKVIEINKGFDIEAIHKAVAQIEHVQGWQREAKGRYVVLESGELGREHLPDPDLPIRPDQRVVDVEQLTGEKSATSIAIETAGPIIQTATSWRELHDLLAKVGMIYERVGSGAKVWVGDVPIKASNIDRNGGLSKLQKRFGPYEPTTQEQPNVYFTHLAADQPHTGNPHHSAEHGMRKLSECNLAHRQVGRKSEGVLQIDVRASRRPDERVRRSSGATNHAAGASRKLVPRPLLPDSEHWTEFNRERAAAKLRKDAAAEALYSGQRDERVALAARQKAEREVMLNMSYAGKGQTLNAVRALLKGQQIGPRLALKERHALQKAAHVAAYPTPPPYEEWLRQKNRPDLAEKWRSRQGIQNRIVGDALVSATPARDLRAYTGHIVGREVHYCSSDAPDQTRAVFVDRGREINVIDWQNRDVTLAALQLAAAKWPDGFKLTGNDEYKRMCIELAVARGFKINNPDLQHQISAERERLAAERNAAAKAAALAADLARDADRETQARIEQLPELKDRAGAAYTFWKFATGAIRDAGGDPMDVNWAQVEIATIQESIGKNKQTPHSVHQALSQLSPGSVDQGRQEAILVEVQAVFEQHRNQTNSKQVGMSKGYE